MTHRASQSARCIVLPDRSQVPGAAWRTADRIVDCFDRRSGIHIDPDRFDTGLGMSPHGPRPHLLAHGRLGPCGAVDLSRRLAHRLRDRRLVPGWCREGREDPSRPSSGHGALPHRPPLTELRISPGLYSPSGRGCHRNAPHPVGEGLELNKVLLRQSCVAVKRSSPR